MTKTIERAVAAVVLVVSSPLIVAVAVLVLLCEGRPILFKQERAGLGGRQFTLYKFRTMTGARDPETRQLLPDDLRVTRFGRGLRATSLDELPELWNIVRGDMAIVGPRPLPIEYLPRYTPEEARRHDVLPGLTGWAQVNGRNSLDWDDRLALDIWYVDHRSVWLDLRIVGRTPPALLRRSGISARGTATMRELRPPA